MDTMASGKMDFHEESVKPRSPSDTVLGSVARGVAAATTASTDIPVYAIPAKNPVCVPSTHLGNMRNRGFTLSGNEETHDYMPMDRHQSFRRSTSFNNGIFSRNDLEAVYVEMKSQHKDFKRMGEELERNVKQQQQQHGRCAESLQKESSVKAALLPPTPPPSPQGLPFAEDEDYSWLPPPVPYNPEKDSEDGHGGGCEGGYRRRGSETCQKSEKTLAPRTGGDTNSDREVVVVEINHSKVMPVDTTTSICSGTVATRVNMFNAQKLFKRHTAHGNEQTSAAAVSQNTPPRSLPSHLTTLPLSFSPPPPYRQPPDYTVRQTRVSPTLDNTAETMGREHEPVARMHQTRTPQNAQMSILKSGQEVVRPNAGNSGEVTGAGRSVAVCDDTSRGVEFGVAQVRYPYSVPQGVIKKFATVRRGGLVEQEKHTSLSNGHVTVVPVHYGEHRRPLQTPQTIGRSQGTIHYEECRQPLQSFQTFGRPEERNHIDTHTPSDSYTPTRCVRHPWFNDPYRPTQEMSPDTNVSMKEDDRVLDVVSQKISVLIDSINRQNKRIDTIQRSLDRQRTRKEASGAPDTTSTYRSLDIFTNEAVDDGVPVAGHKKGNKDKHKRKSSHASSPVKPAALSEKSKWKMMSCVH